VRKSVQRVTVPGGTNSPTMARGQGEVIAEGLNDRAIEQVVGRLSLEPSVPNAPWRIAEADDD
jgi:hypothetical protein